MAAREAAAISRQWRSGRWQQISGGSRLAAGARGGGFSGGPSGRGIGAMTGTETAAMEGMRQHEWSKRRLIGTHNERRDSLTSLPCNTR
eukprot:6179106-Pleurochrysis_carterae.AAC.6